MDVKMSEIKVRLIPKSSRNQVMGREGEIYRVKVTSPPVDGKANRELIVLLAKRFGVPKGDIEIISGETSRIKTLRIRGRDIEEITKMLEGN